MLFLFPGVFPVRLHIRLSLSVLKSQCGFQFLHRDKSSLGVWLLSFTYIHNSGIYSKKKLIILFHLISQCKLRLDGIFYWRLQGRNHTSCPRYEGQAPVPIARWLSFLAIGQLSSIGRWKGGKTGMRECQRIRYTRTVLDNYSTTPTQADIFLGGSKASVVLIELIIYIREGGSGRGATGHENSALPI